MRNQKGLTLIEVLGAITLLAVAIMGLIYLLQQTTLFSKQNEKLDRDVIVARAVMEEIKNHLSGSASTLTLYEQSVDLAALRAVPLVPPTLPITIYYPNANTQQIKIEIRSIPFPYTSDTITIKGKSYKISDYFRLIQVTSTDQSGRATAQPYTLEGYAQYK